MESEYSFRAAVLIVTIFMTASCSSSSTPAGDTAADGSTPSVGSDATTVSGNDGAGGEAAAATDDGGAETSVATPDAAKSDAAALDAAAPDGDGGPVSVTLQFKAKVGTKDFACGTTYAAQGSTIVSVQPRDFRFYLQDVRLVDSQGNDVPVVLDTRAPWQTPDVALLDFENASGACAAEGNPEMNTVVTGAVPPGTYTGIVFTNGVPDSLNHEDPLKVPAPLQPSPMTWGWLYGYKFIKAELAATGLPTGDAAPGLGLLHVGSIACSNVSDGGTPNYNAPPSVACAQANRNEIRLMGFNPASSVIVADIGALFANVDLSRDNQCHSNGDPSCGSEFTAVGLDFDTGTRLTTQSLYRIE